MRWLVERRSDGVLFAPFDKGGKGQPIRGVLVGEGQLSHGSINEIKDFESRTSTPSRRFC